MANREVTTPAPGVTRTECHWGYYLQGKKDALIRAGLVREEWFPTGERDSRGRVIRRRKVEHEGRWIRVIDQGSHIYVGVDYSERELIAIELAEAREAVYHKISCLPKDAESYRADCVDLMARLINAFTSTRSTGEYTGYRLHPATLSEIERIGGHLRNAIETGKVLFDREARQASIAKFLRELPEQDAAMGRVDSLSSAKADPAFQAFMTAATTRKKRPAAR
jgi:hypothetical protein